MYFSKKIVLIVVALIVIITIISIHFISSNNKFFSSDTNSDVLDYSKDDQTHELPKNEILSTYNEAIKKSMTKKDPTYNIDTLNNIVVLGYIDLDEDNSYGYEKTNIPGTINKYNGFKKEIFPAAPLISDDIISCVGLENDNDIELQLTVNGCKFAQSEFSTDTSIGKTGCSLGNIEKILNLFDTKITNISVDSYLEYSPVVITCLIDKNGEFIDCRWKYSVSINLVNDRIVSENINNKSANIDTLLKFNVGFDYPYVEYKR